MLPQRLDDDSADDGGGGTSTEITWVDPTSFGFFVF